MSPAALALERAGPAAVQVDIGYFTSGGRPSGGTLASLVGAVRAPSFSWRDGELVTERGGVRTARFNIGGKRVDALSFGGSEHFGLPRSYPWLRTVGTYLGWFGPLTRGVAGCRRRPGRDGEGARRSGAHRPGVTAAPARLDRWTGCGCSGSDEVDVRRRGT